LLEPHRSHRTHRYYAWRRRHQATRTCEGLLPLSQMRQHLLLCPRRGFQLKHVSGLLAEDGPAVVNGNRCLEKLGVVHEYVKPSVHGVSVAPYLSLIVGMGFVEQTLRDNAQHVNHHFPVGGTKPFLQRVNLIDVIAQRHRIRFRLLSHRSSGIVQKKNFVRMKLHGTGYFELLFNLPTIYHITNVCGPYSRYTSLLRPTALKRITRERALSTAFAHTGDGSM